MYGKALTPTVGNSPQLIALSIARVRDQTSFRNKKMAHPLRYYRSDPGWSPMREYSPMQSRGPTAGRELNLEKESENATIPQARAFECDGCGESFTSWERRRQHQVDCKSDDSDDWL
jgi:hypothetical protein